METSVTRDQVKFVRLSLNKLQDLDFGGDLGGGRGRRQGNRSGTKSGRGGGCEEVGERGGGM